MKPWLLCMICVATFVGGDMCAAGAQGGNRAQVDSDRGVGARRVYLVPIGDTPASLIDTLIVQCRQKLNLSVDTLPRLGSDRVWLDPDRNQIVAERVIASMRQRYPRHARNDAVIIGITSADMYIARIAWRFAFGFRPGGDTGQRVAVLSTARMTPEFFNEPRNDNLMMERLRKMVIRYLGVLYFELPFNTDPESVLYKDLLGVQELDAMGEDLPHGPRRTTTSPTGRRP
jgi:predicted Zn-dependent protease